MIQLKARAYDAIIHELGRALLEGSRPVDAATWQSQSVEGRPGMGRTWELEDVSLEVAIPDTIEDMVQLVKPNLPWADVHFQERVGGVPVNPPPSTAIWPFKQNGHAEHVDRSGKFSHTYPERFWPGHVGHGTALCNMANELDRSERSFCEFGPTQGIRYAYGDLIDVVSLLEQDPTTRQAYLPIWFPEDTGAVQGQRVPCSLGYQFKCREGRLNCTYTMRSCDYLRHMADDVYMAMRLTNWIVGRLNDALSVNDEPVDNWIVPGRLVMHIGSLHVFDGDMPLMRPLVQQMADRLSKRMIEAMNR